jgi:hypothetical protein
LVGLFETPENRANWLLYADPQVAPSPRSQAGSITPIINWLHYADPALDPLRRSRIGSIAAIVDTVPAPYRWNRSAA